MSLDALFRPRSVAVFGASPQQGTIGHQIVRNLLDAGFTGRIIPINRRGDPVCGLPAVTSLEPMEGPVDLVHVAIRGDQVLRVLEQCPRAGVRAIVVHSAGFAEAGPEGRALQDRLVAAARERGVRLLGPNAQGVQNGDPAIRLYGTFTFTPLREGPVSIVAQSGGVAELLNLHLWKAGVGIRLYASPGNAADIGLAELTEEVARDPGTRVLLLHLEGIPDPDRLLQGLVRCRQAGQEVLVLAGAVQEAARQAVVSHTGALAASGGVLEALLARSGARWVRESREAVELAVGRCHHPPARGRRIAVICNAGGTGILALQAALEAGMEPAELGERTREELRRGQSPFVSIGTLVDLTATATPEQLGSAIRCAFEAPEVDGVLVSLVTPFWLDEGALGRAVVEAVHGRSKPVVVHLMANPRGSQASRILREAGIVLRDFPEEAARALAAMVPTEPLANPGPGTIRLESSGDPAASPPGRWLSLPEAFELLEREGIPCLPRWVVEAPDRIPPPPFPAPWVVKADLPGGAHKARLGGVVLGLETLEDLDRAIRRLSVDFPGRTLVVQPQIHGGIEMALGLIRDPSGLPITMAGPGGTSIELRKGRRFRLAPVSLEEARSALGIASDDRFPGVTPAVLEALAQYWTILSRLPFRVPDLEEMDLNPMLWTPSGLVAADARVRLLPASDRRALADRPSSGGSGRRT